MSNSRTGTVGTWRLAAYASPALVTSLAWMPLGYVVVKFYGKYTSLDITQIGLIVLVARLFDALSDPLVAYLSDRFDTRWGRRKPWIVLSAPMISTGFLLLFSPPQSLHWSYFLLANIVMYSGWTFFEITHVAWGLEFDRNHESRSRIGLLLKLAAYVGSLLFFAFPFLFNPNPESSEFTPEVMQSLGICIAASFPLLALLAVSAAPTERRLGGLPFNAFSAVREMAVNSNFRAYLAAFSFWALADSIVVALFIVYIDAVHGLSAAEGMILLAAYSARLAGVPLAIKLFHRYSRKSLWIGCVTATGLVYPLLLLFPTGGEALPYLVVFAVVLGLVDCVVGVLAITILGDVVDEDAIRTSRDKAASYKAVVNLAEKTVRAVGTSACLLAVGSAGLVIGSSNTASAVLALTLVLALAPAVMNLASALSMRKLQVANAAPARRQP